MKKAITTVLVLMLGLVHLSAQSLPILNVPLDAKALATGSTLSPSAGLFALEGKTLDASASYGLWMPSVSTTTMIGLDAKAHFGKLAFGLFGDFYTEESYNIINEQGISKGTFTPKESMLGLGVAYAVLPILSVGVNAKFISSTIASEVSASSVAFDAVVSCKFDALRISAGAYNLGGGLDYGYGKNSLPSLARVNAAYTLTFGVAVSAEGDYLFNGAVMGGAGLSYDIMGFADVRAGYHFGDAAKAIPSYAAVGAGVHVLGLKFDFTYLLASENLGGTMMFGLGYSF